MKRITFVLSLLCTIASISASKEDIINLRSLNKNIRSDLRYGTKNNFSGKPLYAYNAVLVHKDTAYRLDKIQQELEQQGLGLLIWDAYRSSREQQKVWEAACMIGAEATEQVSNPATSSGYKNRGSHVELTIVDKNGKPLEMPTDFDELIDKACSDYRDLPTHVIANRTLLHDIMAKHGFKNYEKEWWYFWMDDSNGKPYPTVELTPEEIESLT